jgi:hypothetical protein
MNPPEPGQPKATGLDLGAITDKAPSDTPPSAAAVVRDEKQDLENQRLKSETLTLDQDRAERLKYAHHVFVLVVAWLIVMA